uniref:Uncharacterized protein n=1 Tax=Sus scrofa TaxID=9823 RepID=A0A4X1ST82_PIG
PESRAKVSSLRWFQNTGRAKEAGKWEQPRSHVTRAPTHPGRRGWAGSAGAWGQGVGSGAGSRVCCLVRRREDRRGHPALPAPGSLHFPSRRGRGQRRSGGWGASRDPCPAARGKRGTPRHPLRWGQGHPGQAGSVPGARPLPARPPAGPVSTPGTERTRAVPGPAPARGRPRSPAPRLRPRPGTFDHVAVDGGTELLARALVEVLSVDDPHLLQEGGLAALARTQQQDLHEPLHVGLLPRQAFVDLFGLALLLGLAARQHAAGEAHGQHGPRRQEVRHLAAAAAAAASAGPSGSLHLLLGRRAAPAPRLEGGERSGDPSAPGEGGNQRTDSQGGPGEPGREGGREGGRAWEGRWPGGRARARCLRGRARTPRRLLRPVRWAGESRSTVNSRPPSGARGEGLKGWGLVFM